MALERALSKLGAASRAEARGLVRDGHVRVNGTVVTNPLAAVVPERDDIRVRGTAVPRSPWRTIAFHKPRGTITTRRDPEGRKTVFDAIGAASDGLVAVGRLDAASTGLLLLTNDTRLADALTNPANAIPRRYVVTVRGHVSADALDTIRTGVGDLRPSSVVLRKRSNRETHLIVELTEGKNREIRRLFDAVGHDVTRLLRVAFGPIALGPLQPGEWREVAREELQFAMGIRSSAPARYQR